ncbi:unnamed protein product [Symbiodinium microadriaticum]|nr:unnamed protein product [Symbiodinium microadriaticum]
MEAATSDQRMGEDIQHVAMMAHREMAADIVAQYQREWMEGSKGESVGASMQKPKQPGLKWRKAVTGEEEKPPPGQSGDKGSAEGKAAGSKDEEKKVGKKKADEKVAVDLAKSLEDKETEAANELGIQIALPSTKENMKFRWSIAMWNVKKVVFPPIRYVKSKYAKHRLKTGNAPMQHSAVLDRYTLFGKVMCDGLTGNIKPILKNNFVSALDLFFYMRDKMRKGIAEWLERVDGPDGQKLLHSQDPVLFVPVDNPQENRLEHVLGMKLLITFAQKEGVGFSRINIREKVALMAMRALKTFPLDNEICAPAFNLIGYCIHGHMHKKLKMTIIKDGLIDQLEKCMAHYRSDSRVMNAVNWLRRVLPYDVPKNGGIALIPFGVEKKEEDELEQ